MIKGRLVTILRAVTTYDESREPVVSVLEESVVNVLVAPGVTSDLLEVSRPEGTKVAFTLALPKPYEKSLRGCRVTIEGEDGEFSVIGDPRPCRENCPTAWWMTVEVEACDG